MESVLQTFFRAFFLIFLMELCSSSQLMLAALAAGSRHPVIVFLGGVSALIITCSIALGVGGILNRVNLPFNLIAGIVLITTGAVMIWRQ